MAQNNVVGPEKLEQADTTYPGLASFDEWSSLDVDAHRLDVVLIEEGTIAAWPRLQGGIREDDDSIVRWIPPWSLADRTRWAKEHPWVAACYFGAYMFFALALAAFVAPPLFGTTANFGFAIGLALAITPIATVLFGFALRSGWAERHGFAPTDPPSLRRPLSLVSDRLLTALAWICPASILITGLDLIVGTPRRPIDFIFSLTFWVGGLALVTVERRHRRRDRREGSPLPPPSDR